MMSLATVSPVRNLRRAVAAGAGLEDLSKLCSAADWPKCDSNSTRAPRMIRTAPKASNKYEKNRLVRLVVIAFSRLHRSPWQRRPKILCAREVTLALRACLPLAPQHQACAGKRATTQQHGQPPSGRLRHLGRGGRGGGRLFIRCAVGGIVLRTVGIFGSAVGGIVGLSRLS